MNTKQHLFWNDQNADKTLLHSHDNFSLIFQITIREFEIKIDIAIFEFSITIDMSTNKPLFGSVVLEIVLRDRPQTPVRRGLMQKENYRKNFSGFPFRPKKIQCPPPLFAMKIMGQPHRKACQLNFHWKICGNYLRPPLQGSNILRALPFCIRPPERSLNSEEISNFQVFFTITQEV